jgi:hypothetical protein
MSEVLVGSLVTPEGVHPFILHLPGGKIELNVYNPLPGLPPLDDVRRRQAEESLHAGIDFPLLDVRWGEYLCGVCGEWRAATPGEWSLSICLYCSLDRDSDLWDFYDGMASNR